MSEAPFIRRAKPDDLPAIRRITEAAYAPYLDVLGAPPVPMTEDYAPRIAAGQVWILEDGGAPRGLIVIEDGAERDEVFSVAVDPSAHGRGHGRALLSHAEHRARANGKTALALYTNALMTRNIALYGRLGFQEIGRRANPKRTEFTIVDMVKPLD